MRPSSLVPRVVCLSVWDSQGILLLGSSGLLPDGRHGMAHTPHVLIQSLPIREALGVTASTNKEEVEVFPHMAKGGLGVLIDNSTVWTEGQLPVLSANGNRLSHQALMPVEVC